MNVEAGIYHEQVFVSLALYGTGAPNNMLTIQAWDTNGDGIIEPNEMPTISAAQSITNWNAVTDANLWAALTGLSAAQFQPNTIFGTPWSPNDTVENPLELVLESDTSALQQTSWPINATSECQPPLYRPSQMAPGSFQYDYANHILYVWRSDGNAPGPAYPIDAASLDSTLTSSVCGNAGAFESTVEYVCLKGIKFRYCNADVSSQCQRTFCVVTVGGHSRVENCNIQWAAWGGLSGADTVVTNCIVSNCGGIAIGITSTLTPALASSNALVCACTITNNNWRFPRQSSNRPANCISASPGVLHIVGYCPGMLISNNTFMNNYQDVIHCDGAQGLPGSPIVIANNFFQNTNFNPLCFCLSDVGIGIELEDSAGINIISNVIISAYGGIAISGSSSNIILNNLIVLAPSLQPYQLQYGSVLALVVLPSVAAGGWTNAAANNQVVGNTFVSYYDAYGSPMVLIGQSDNASNATPFGPLEFNNVYSDNRLWNYPQSRNPSGPSISLALVAAPYHQDSVIYTNAWDFFQAAAGTDGTVRNVRNSIAAPVGSPGLSLAPGNLFAVPKTPLPSKLGR